MSARPGQGSGHEGAGDGAAHAPLHRALGPGSALLVTIGAMVGSGVFATPHEVAGLVRTPAAMLFVWIAGGLLSLLGALTYAEIGAALPETGGLYAHLRRAWGPRVAFVFGWAMTAVLVPSSVGYFAQVSARHVLEAAGLSHGDGPVRVFSSVMIASLVAANLAGVRSGARVQNAATVVKYLGVLLVAGLGAWLGTRSGFAQFSSVSPGASAPPSWGVTVLLAALVPALWAYDGWIELTSVAGELRDPERDIPRALVRGTLAVTALYLLVNLGYLAALGAAGLASSETPAIATASMALGARGRVAIGALVAVSTFGGCAVSLLTGARVLYAVGRDGLSTRWLGLVSARGVPAGALITAGALGLAYAISPLGRLGEIFVIGAWPFYALGALGLTRLRAAAARGGGRWPVKVWGQPALAWIFALVGLGIVLAYAAREPLRTGLSFALIAVGFPVRAFTQRRRGSRVGPSS